jgi:hypothetical protein
LLPQPGPLAEAVTAVSQVTNGMARLSLRRPLT